MRSVALAISQLQRAAKLGRLEAAALSLTPWSDPDISNNKKREPGERSYERRSVVPAPIQ
jgi:hypothetical protein